MIELVYEIRRKVPSSLKPGIKLANPELFNELINYYHQDKDASTVTKALIKELLSLAGESWLLSLKEGKPQEGNHRTAIYRGSVSLEEKNTQAEKKSTEESKRSKKKIYRGQIVN